MRCSARISTVSLINLSVYQWLAKCFSKLTIHNFPDNANLLFQSKKLGTIESVINHEVELKVLSLNEAKTELIIFSSLQKHISHDPEIKIKNCKHNSSNSSKTYLSLLVRFCLGTNKLPTSNALNYVEQTE